MAADWKRRGSCWVLDTQTHRYRITQTRNDVFIVNRIIKDTNNLTQFGNGHHTLAQAQAWVDNDKE